MTAGTTSQFPSRRTGAVDDDHEPRALLPGSHADEDPERRRRPGRPAGDRAAVGRAALGTPQLRVRRPVRPGAREDPRQLPHQPEPGTAAGGVGERLLRQRQVTPCPCPRVPLARCRASERRACPRPRHAHRRGPRPPHRAVDGREAPGWPLVGCRHARLGQERCGATGVPVDPVRERRAPHPVRTRPLHDLGEGERLPRRGASGRGGGRPDLRQGGPRPLRVTRDREGAPRRRPDARAAP